MYRYGRYIGYRPIIGFADTEYPYQYWLSALADMNAHIGSLTNIL